MGIAYVTFGDRTYRVGGDGVLEDIHGTAAADAEPKKLRVSAFVFFIAAAAGVLLVVSGNTEKAYGDRIAYWWKNHRNAVPLIRSTQQAYVAGFLPLSGDLGPALLPKEAPALQASQNGTVQKPYLAIPKLRIQAPIIETELDEKNIDKNLERGIVRWPTSDAPGTGGAAILLGHSSAPRSYRGAYGKVFSLLDKLEVGDAITITTQEGTLQYRVRDRIIVDPKQTDEWVLQLRDTRETLILVSCWPVGTNWKRIAVRASRF